MSRGYEMVTDYKQIDGANQFATTYVTPEYVLDVRCDVDENTGKKVYDKGFLRISKK